MPILIELFPNPDTLVATPITDLAPILLGLARNKMAAPPGNSMFIPSTIDEVPIAFHISPYPHYKQQQVDNHLSAAWDWLRTNGFIALAPDINGRNGWMIITSKGQGVAEGRDFTRIMKAMAFPKELIHPSIAEKTWGALMRNDLDEAVFAAFKALEVAVRQAGSFAATDIGVPLMRKAFDKNTGPLTNMAQPEAERDALAHLFAGAIGSYKNPHSHRTVALSDLREAQEQVLLASHLLSIVDARRAP